MVIVIHVIVRDTLVSMMAHMNAKTVIIIINATIEDNTQETERERRVSASSVRRERSAIAKRDQARGSYRVEVGTWRLAECADIDMGLRNHSCLGQCDEH